MLATPPEELEGLLFGLVMTSLLGGRTRGAKDTNGITLKRVK